MVSVAENRCGDKRENRIVKPNESLAIAEPPTLDTAIEFDPAAGTVGDRDVDSVAVRLKPASPRMIHSASGAAFVT